MTNERLPIKFFGKRKVDEMRTEGGGDKRLPQFVLSGEELYEHRAGLLKSIEGFKEYVNNNISEDSLVPFMMSVKVTDKAHAKTHRNKIKELFQASGKNSVVGIRNDNELIINIKKVSELDEIESRVNNTEKYKHAISAVDEINPFHPYVDFEEDAKSYKLKLVDYQNYEFNTAIQRHLEIYMKQQNINYTKEHYASNYDVYHILSTELDDLNGIISSDISRAIFSFEPMPYFKVSLDLFEDDESVNIAEPNEEEEYTTIGVLDSGIAGIPHLSPWLHNEEYSPYPSHLRDDSHGTFVAGIVLYGDELEGEIWTKSPKFKLLNANIVPDLKVESQSEAELISNIREAISKYHNEVKIWNLSVSWGSEVNDHSFSDLGIALDDLQDMFNVLICKSAGNCKNFVKNLPKGRIYEGADSVRSIVVGSIAHKQNKFDYAIAENPSPFSRVGRGPAYIIKPEVVHYGGNAGVNEDGDLVVNGVKSYGSDGNVKTAVGTSFSTPRITALAGGLFHAMNEEFDPLLIKALIIHSSKYSSKLIIPEEERINQLGFGKPQNVENILYNDPSEVTLILRDTMVRGEFIDIMDFPMPEELVVDGYFKGQITVTLVYNPLLEPTQQAEYCQSNIDVYLGTYDDKVPRDVTKNSILNPIGRSASKNLLNTDAYSKRKMNADNSVFALEERMKIKFHNKFYPVKKYTANLADMTEANRDILLSDDRKWYLKLEGLYREFVEDKVERDQCIASQDFCLIITIKDPDGQVDVYDKVTQKLDQFQFWHNNIQLRSEVEQHV